MLEKEPPPGISCWPKGDQVNELEALIEGANDTPYANGHFKLEITISDSYPLEPPKVRFLTKIYHPNIENGRICLDTLVMPPKGQWKPALNVEKVLLTIQALLSKPNPDDGLIPEISVEYKDNYSLFEAKAREYTKKYATNVTDSDTTTTTITESTSLVTPSTTTTTTTSPAKSKILLSSREQISVEGNKLENKESESKLISKKENIFEKKKIGKGKSNEEEKIEEQKLRKKGKSKEEEKIDERKLEKKGKIEEKKSVKKSKREEGKSEVLGINMISNKENIEKEKKSKKKGRREEGKSEKKSEKKPRRFRRKLT